MTSEICITDYNNIQNTHTKLYHIINSKTSTEAITRRTEMLNVMLQYLWCKLACEKE